MNRNDRRLAKTSRCQAIEFHDDMYPEFAPEPLEIPCQRRAERLVISLVSAHYSNCKSMLVRECLCLEHASQAAADTYGMDAVLVKPLGR